MRLMATIFGVGLALTLAGVGRAAELPAGPPASDNLTTVLKTTGATNDAVAVPVPSEQAVRFYQGGLFWWSVAVVWSWGVPILVLFSGLSGRLGRITERFGKKEVFVTVLFVVGYFLIRFALYLPLHYWTGFVRMHEYGLSNQTLGRWLHTRIVDAAVWTAIYAAVFVVLRSLLRWSPRRWWIYSSIFVTGVIFFYVLIRPVWVDPLTNKFGAMQDKQLEADILALAERAGIEGSRVFEVDMSRDTKETNAYVAGLGATKRIVFWDTLLTQLNREEALFIMAHEMGHYVLRHVISGCVVTALVYALSLFLIDRIGRGLIVRFKQRFGFERLEDVAAIPVFLLMFNVLLFLTSPILNAHSRYNEHEADRFALEITRNPQAAAQGFVKLQTDNLGVPYPYLIDKLWRNSHPSLGERIEFANTYRPWVQGQPGRYDHLFTNPAPAK